MRQVFLCGIAICLLMSCSKHHDKPGDQGNDPDPAPASLVRLKSVNTNTYLYDSLGRLIRASYGNSITARTDYTYYKDSVVGKDFDLQGNPHGGGTVYYLGGDGLATKLKYIIDSSVPPLIFTFTYNADRQLTEQVLTEEGQGPSTRTVYYYTRGNYDSAKTFRVSDNSLLQTERFEYFNDQPNLLGNEHRGAGFIGVDNANLPKKEVQINAGATTTIEYTYEFDANKRPVKQHMFVDGSAWSDLDYTWVIL